MAQTKRIKPSTPVVDLVEWPLLDDLTASGLAVYLRLVARSAKHGSRMRVRNADLHNEPRTAQRALHELAKHGLLRTSYDAVDNSRTVELL